MQIHLTNTLTRQKEIFQPIQTDKVSIYTCGPTVYATPHIGNFRAFIFSDLLRRSLEFLGLKVNHVMNITDVGHLTSDGNEGEDKLEKGAAREGISPFEVARKYEDEFKRDLKKLNIKTPHELPRASEHIKEQITLIKQLEAKGYTYETSDGIYFDTAKFANYGKLSGQKMEEKEAGARVEVKSEKKNPADFALWKFCVAENENHILRWDIETGEDLSESPKSKVQSPKSKIGFPGWHLECSAMSLKHLAPKTLPTTNNQQPTTIDIHTGGIDHIPVHHENEIAQSEAATGQKFVNYWLHNEFLTVDGGKMSKSLGNLFTLSDLKARDFDPLAFRYLCLNSHYRSKLNFTWEALKNAQNSLEKLRNIVDELPIGSAPDPISLKKFQEAISNDLDIPKALSIVWDVAKNSCMNKAQKKVSLIQFDHVLGLDLFKIPKKLNLSAGQKQLIDERSEARKGKNFARADFIRKQCECESEGLQIKDTPNSQVITSSNGDVIEIPFK
jgi:cysteinyl-tRNA synthetase